MDFINREDLLSDLTESVVFTVRDRHSAEIRGARKIIDRIEAAPTVDVVPVVRCGQCEHWDEEIGWCDVHSCFIDSDGIPCSPNESSNWKMFDEDYFCKDGVRKEQK